MELIKVSLAAYDDKRWIMDDVIRSYLHDIYTEEMNKVVLSADDDKRHILGDGIPTLAHGHDRLR